MTVGVVTGLVFEAEILRAALNDRPDLPQPMIFVAGAHAGRAEAGARDLVGKGAKALLSFGVAGGLDPALKAGDLILADQVISSGELALATDAPWRQAVHDAMSGPATVHVTAMLSVARAVQDIEAKAGLFREAGAGAVDMESYAVARAAAEANIPMLAVRAIADTAGRGLPRLGVKPIRPDGTIRTGSILAALMRNPSDLARLLGVAADTAKARETLRRVAARHLGALLRR